ncbi:MAG: hypothetical protein MJ219_01270 [Mycoplasmoidaceae bacterium]|nr:hypothetical protein [Mycoplasmoidaceae bacterium]
MQKHYGIDNFVGLSRTVPLNGIKHKVTVIGQNADIDKDGKKIALTFQFDTLICDVNGEALTLSLRDKKTDY